MALGTLKNYGWTRERLDAYDHNETIRMYYDYKNGEHVEEYKNYICSLMFNFGIALIQKKHRTAGAEFEDLQADVMSAVLEALPNYNPELTVPSNYFGNFIVAGTKSSLNNHISPHYMHILNQINSVCVNDLKLSGIDDPLAPKNLAVIISEVTGISLKTIQEAIKYSEITVSSYDLTQDNVDVSIDPYPSPEQAIIKAEESALLMESFATLTPFEQFVMTKVDLEDNPMSYAQITKLLKDPEVYEVYKDEFQGHKVNSNTVQSFHERARRKLRQNKKIRAYAGKSKIDLSYEEVEQASFDDFEDAFANQAIIEIL